MSANPMLDYHGGAIPSARLLPLIERFEARNVLGRGNELLARRIYKVRHDVAEVSLDFADRLLIDMGMQEEWHLELADLNETAAAVSTHLCACGCGEFTSLAVQSRTSRGQRKGQPVRFRPGHNSKVPRRMTATQIRAAYTLYQSGLSTREVARLIWRQLGFANERACLSGLQRAFTSTGRPRRSFTESELLRWSRRGCNGCGCPMDERTKGCHNCETRHYQRMLSGLPYVPGRRTCSRCECPFDERTRGCGACRARHSKRKERGPGSSGVETAGAVFAAADRKQPAGAATPVKPTERRKRQLVTARSDERTVAA